MIQLAGKQFKVSEGEKLEVTRIDGQENDKITISDVLLVADGEDIKIGEPILSGAKVTLKIISQGKGDKIRVAKFKSKSRYRRVKGFRPTVTALEVVKIG